jgi:hypothetical protein
MPARSIAFMIPVLVLTQAGAAHAQDSTACDAKQLCSKSSACVAGGSIIGDHLTGDVSGMMSWHSDVFRQDIPGAIAKQSYCYYRVISITSPTVLPLFWRPAGLKYLGSRAGKEKGCVFACTESKWDDKGPPKQPIKGDIQYQTDGQSKYAESWGPEAGWTATDQGSLKSAPDPADPGSGSKTLVAQELGDVRVEFETQSLPGGQIRYSIRNVGLAEVRVVWNIPKNKVLSNAEGPFTRSGIELGAGQSFEYNAAVLEGDNDAHIIRWQTQVSVRIVGGPAILAAIPAAGPSNGSFASNPIEFWQQAGLPQ